MRFYTYHNIRWQRIDLYPRGKQPQLWTTLILQQIFNYSQLRSSSIFQQDFCVLRDANIKVKAKDVPTRKFNQKTILQLTFAQFLANNWLHRAFWSSFPGFCVNFCVDDRFFHFLRILIKLSARASNIVYSRRVINVVFFI